MRCRRCGGFVYRERDDYGAWLTCLNCGGVVYDMPALNALPPEKEGTRRRYERIRRTRARRAGVLL